MSASSERKRGRAVNGVLLLDKPMSITSQGAVTRVKSLFEAAKAGHTGTLDPMATGLLPVTFGEATKFSQALLDADKAYLATVRLGLTTTTGDLEGETLTRSAVEVDRSQIDAAVAHFRGEIVQTPPMYSALKHAGKPLYEYARAGTDVVRVPRRVTIHALRVDRYEGPELRIDVACSKGTYIRVLAEDIGQALGCGATLVGLRRTRVGAFSVDDAVTLDALSSMTDDVRSRHLRPVDALLAGLPALELDADQTQRMVRGQVVALQPTIIGLVRVYGRGSRFLGVAEASPDGHLVARRLLSTGAVKA
ncbi:MAG TPA: tRNA pseudouridine(55) synthase TruB [Burkholderiales bacterium]|nr:tRNA pseudouridine(55) synthase TruB [Burkholderiales bacterium]